MSLFKISTSPVRPNDVFELVPLKSGQTVTLLQYRASDASRPSFPEYGVTVVGDVSGAVLVELVETDEPAVVVPLQPEDVQLIDSFAQNSGLSNYFNIDDERKGVGHSAAEEGTVEHVRAMDQQVAFVNTPLVRTFPSSTVITPNGSRINKTAPRMTAGRVVRLRVKAPQSSTPLFAHAYIMIDQG